jgi:hypothetical protein
MDKETLLLDPGLSAAPGASGPATPAYPVWVDDRAFGVKFTRLSTQRNIAARQNLP